MFEGYKPHIRVHKRKRSSPNIDPTNPIFAKNIKIIRRDGTIESYTHIVQVNINRENVVIYGERDDESGMRANVADQYNTDAIGYMTIEFYIPKR